MRKSYGRNLLISLKMLIYEGEKKDIKKKKERKKKNRDFIEEYRKHAVL